MQVIKRTIAGLYGKIIPNHNHLPIGSARHNHLLRLTIHRSMKKLIKDVLSLFGYQLLPINNFLTIKTDRQILVNMMKRLHPVHANKELIRLGPKGDGGYLLPDDLDGIEACFSPGVSSISGFELECANRGMDVFLADYSVEQPAEMHKRFHFSKKFIGVTTDDRFMTLDDWVKASCPNQDSDLLLQIDVEGAEYESLLSASDALIRRFRIIVAEFHWLDQLWNRPYYNLVSRAFDKLLQTHTCVHAHPNNADGSFTMHGLELPRTMEFTFVLNSRVQANNYQSTFPSHLDFDNTDKAPLPLPKCWYRSETSR